MKKQVQQRELQFLDVLLMLEDV